MTERLERDLSNPRSPLEREIAAMGPWFHNLHLPDGTCTAPEHPLGDFPSFKWQQVSRSLPEDLTGWRALDIGCNAGFYSFELARRGADVVGVEPDPRYLRQARWAAARYGVEDRVRFEELQIYDLARLDWRFELVLFLGVFYHLRYPFLALEIVARLTERLLVFQTLTLSDDAPPRLRDDVPFESRDELAAPGWPKMAFVERRFAGDPTNWWVPNAAAVDGMLRSCGMETLERPGHEMWIASPDGRRSSETEEIDFSQYAAATGRGEPGPRQRRSG